MSQRFPIVQIGFAFLLLSVQGPVAADGKLSAKTITLVSTSVGLRPLFEALVPAYAEIGLRAEYLELPASRLNQGAHDGSLEAIIAVSERYMKMLADHYEALGIGTQPLGESHLCLYTRNADQGLFRPDPKSWQNRTIGVIVSVGPNLTEAYLKDVEGVHLMTAPSYSSLVKMLDGRRFDFMIATQGAVEPEIEAAGLVDRIVRNPQPLATIRYYHALNKKLGNMEPGLAAALLRHRNQINQAVNALINR